MSYRAADLAVRWLPARAVEALGVQLARAAYRWPSPARTAAVGNLQRLEGGTAQPAAEARARETFEHFALALVDFMRLDRLGPAAIAAATAVRGAAHLEEAERSGRGVIVLSAHLGNWEWGAAFLAARGVRLHLVARPHPEAGVETFFASRRARWGVARLDGRPLWRDAAARLRRGDWIAVMGDRPAATRGSACAWAAALARRTGAIVLPAVIVRTGAGRYEACFEPPLSPAACVAGGYRDAMRRHLESRSWQWCAFEPLPEGLV